MYIYIFYIYIYIYMHVFMYAYIITIHSVTNIMSFVLNDFCLSKYLSIYWTKTPILSLFWCCFVLLLLLRILFRRFFYRTYEWKNLGNISKILLNLFDVCFWYFDIIIKGNNAIVITNNYNTFYILYSFKIFWQNK